MSEVLDDCLLCLVFLLLIMIHNAGLLPIGTWFFGSLANEITESQCTLKQRKLSWNKQYVVFSYCYVSLHAPEKVDSVYTDIPKRHKPKKSYLDLSFNHHYFWWHNENIPGFFLQCVYTLLRLRPRWEGIIGWQVLSNIH